MKKLLVLCSILLTVFVMSGCSKKEDTLNLSVAASLKDSMTEIERIYAEVSPDTKLMINFGSSGSLQQQIEQGAPVDIFISASNKQMNALEEKELLLPNTRKALLKNTVVLAAPASSSISSFDDLLSENIQKIGIGEPTSVPIGEYATEIFEFLGITEDISDKLVYAKDAPEIKAWTETGNVDASITFKTEVLSSENIKLVEEAPINSHTPVEYPIAIIKSTKNESSAKAFIDFLHSEEAQKIFSEQGFSMAE